jgi:phosphoglycolate phosphatase
METKKYDAVIFDLDGTLLNTLEDLTDSVNYVMEQMGYPTHPIEHIRQFVGNGIRRLMILSTPQGEDNPNFEEAFGMFQEYYLGHNLIKTRPYDGIMELLDQMQKQKIPMAIVSNKNQPSVDLLREQVFCGKIPVALGDEPGRARKPAPDGVWEAMKRLQLPEDAAILYVGDSEVDAATAAAAGLDCCLCTWGFRPMSLLETLPHTLLLEKPLQLLEHLR